METGKGFGAIEAQRSFIPLKAINIKMTAQNNSGIERKWKKTMS
jgi:hypothetical protein